MADNLKDYIQKSREYLDRDEPRLDFKESLLAELKNRTAQKRPWFVRVYDKRLAVAASLLLLLICAFLIWQDDSVDSDVFVSNPGAHLQKTTASVNALDTMNELIANNPNQLKSQNPLFPVKNNPLPLKTTKLTNVRKQHKPESVVANEDPASIVNLEVPQPTDGMKSSSNVDLVHSQQTDIAQTLSNEATTSLNPAEVKQEAQLQTIQEPVMESSGQEQTLAVESDQTQNVGSYIKKGVWSFLKKKAKQITNNALDIQSDDSKQPTALALHFKSDLIEVQKTIPLNRESD